VGEGKSAEASLVLPMKLVSAGFDIQDSVPEESRSRQVNALVESDEKVKKSKGRYKTKEKVF